MKILVTGGAGFIGSHVVERLLGRGDEVCVLDNFNDFYDPALKRENVKSMESVGGDRLSVVEGDIRDLDCVHKLFANQRFDVVVHLAAMAGVRRSISDPLLYSDVNIRGTQVLLEEVRNADTRFVFASSSSVYGANESVPFSEADDIHQPMSPYAATKRAGELLCFTHQHLYGTPMTCLRFFTVYGPRQRPEMAIHKFVRMCLAGQALPFFGDGTTQRDYTYIDDIVDGVERAVGRTDGYAIYNLGESKTISLSDLVVEIGRVTGVEPILERLPMQPGDVLITYANVDKARADLGYDPSTSITDGLEKFLEWYKATRLAGVRSH